MWQHEVVFDPAAAEQTLAQLPDTPAVYALFGREPGAEPYVGRTPSLRRRLRRLLTPSVAHPRRLHLAGLVARIAYAETASELEATLLLYRVTQEAFGSRAAKRMHLRTPSFLRMAMANSYPRLYVTSTVTDAAASNLFGPFASRPAAERYAEEVLDLFLLRHCYQDLDPDSAFPGCIYSEMKKCLAPCYGGCTDERYALEASEVHAFLSTGGKSLQAKIADERDKASQALDFEGAAAAHARLGKIEAVAGLASEAARPLASQYAVIVQPAFAPGAAASDEQVALFLFKQGALSGPVLYSVAGMRHPNEQSGSSSLFAHPVAFAAVPLGPQAKPVKTDVLEERLEHALAALEAAQPPRSRQLLCDHLSIFARWYYRPEIKRTGEVVFFSSKPEQKNTPPEKLVLRAISRVWRCSQAQKTTASETAAGLTPASVMYPS